MRRVLISNTCPLCRVYLGLINWILLVRLHVDTRLIWPSVPNLSDCTSATTTGCILLQPNFMSMWKDVVFHLIDKMCKEYLNEWMSTLIKIWSYDKDYNAYNQKNLVVNTFKLTDYEILLMKLTTYPFKPFMQYLYILFGKFLIWFN